MSRKQRWIPAVLALLLLLNAGCGKSSGSIKDNIALPTVPADSLDSLRQTMAGTSQLFAVAYFGYHHSEVPGLPVDPAGVMAEYAPGLCEKLPFLQEISADRVIGEEGDLFCIVPLDADAAVAVSRGYWDEENGQYIYDDMIYSSMSGEPFLVFCNNDGWEPDTQVFVSGSSGAVYWCPGTDINGYASQAAFLDVSPYGELLKAEYRWLKDCGWILPTRDQLMGTSWSWNQYLADGTERSCEMSIDMDFLTARWYDGEEHVYQDATWELTYEDDTAVLSIDFGEMAGVLRYNLLYEESYGELYVSLDVTRGDISAGDEPLFRYLTMTSIPDPASMVGTWELGWTEVEGDINGAEPGSQIIEITADQEGRYRISYINRERPDWSFYGQELEVVSHALYEGCGNNRWSATVNYIGFGDTEYSLTLLPEGTLLLRNYWELEGFRNVSHGWYTRASAEASYG